MSVDRPPVAPLAAAEPAAQATTHLSSDPTPTPPEGEASTSRRQALAPWLLAAAMTGAALLLAVPGYLAAPAAAVPDLWWLALLPLFALAEVVVIHLPTQRHAHGHTLREIPAVLGLTFLAPQQYVSAYVLGAVVGLVLAARMGGVKLAFNASMFALEAALGVATYHLVLQGGDPISPAGWVAVLVAVLVTDLMSAAAVTAAISVTEGVFDTEVLREALRSGTVAAFINTCVALLVATLVLVKPSALPLLGVVVVLLVMAYRVYVSLARGHAQTRLLYRFVDRTSAARSAEEVIEAVLRESAELMHAEHAYLVEVLEDQRVRHHAFEGGVLRAGTVDLAQVGRPWWWPALGTDSVHHERRGRRDTSDPVPGPALTSAPRDGLAARLRGTGTDLSRHVLVVADRSFEKESFGTDDLEVFEALAAHTSVALERARTVTDLEAVAAELETARDAALAASEAKSVFLANMSHEIRTPLTIVLATAEMLEDTDLDDEQRDLLERMERSGGSLKSLVETILDFSRIEAGQVELAEKPFDLHALAADVSGIYQLRTAKTGNRFVHHLGPAVPRTVLGDPGRLFQVLSNLLDNAVKFTHEGEVGLTVRRVPSDAHHEELLELAVHDTGIGIAPEDQASIFEVFNQVDGSTTRRYEGTGLGLAICKQLTELMGGTIDVEAQPGAGSTFTVRVPLVEVHPGRPTDTGESDGVRPGGLLA